MIDKKKQGRRNRINGANFERRVRKDLEENWIVDRWTNNIELQKENSVDVFGFHDGEKFIYGKCTTAKSNRFNTRTNGFPDFMAFKQYVKSDKTVLYELIFIECKINGQLDKIEREKARWYLANNYCSKFLVASKIKEKNRIKIKYKEFQ